MPPPTLKVVLSVEAPEIDSDVPPTAPVEVMGPVNPAAVTCPPKLAEVPLIAPPVNVDAETFPKKEAAEAPVTLPVTVTLPESDVSAPPLCVSDPTIVVFAKLLAPLTASPPLSAVDPVAVRFPPRFVAPVTTVIPPAETVRPPVPTMSPDPTPRVPPTEALFVTLSEVPAAVMPTAFAKVHEYDVDCNTA